MRVSPRAHRDIVLAPENILPNIHPHRIGTDRGLPIIVWTLKTLKASPGTPLGIGCARVLANIFSKPTSKFSLFDRRQQLLDALHTLLSEYTQKPWHKQVKLSIATCILNLSIVFDEKAEKAGRWDFLGVCELFLKTVTDDPECSYRVLVACGNVLVSAGNCAIGSCPTGDAKYATDAARLKAAMGALGGSPEAKVQEAAKEVVTLL